ncbi:MAG TPA: hypothetical protein VH092_06150 [Urbifossiella sp.]|jgi:hypothetical protein|nr:hypothetical protein [Urbifossiella sp.]
MSVLHDSWYEAAAREVQDGKPIPGLWARVFAHADGDRNRATACYIRLRAAALLQEQVRGVEGQLSALVPSLLANQPVVCPYCAWLGRAGRQERDALVRLLCGGPRFDYSCGSCGRALGPLPTPSTPPAGSDETENHPRVRPVGIAALVVGLLSMVLYPIILIPLTAAGCGLVGLLSYDPSRHRGGWMSAVGLILGTLYLVMSASANGLVR